MWKVFPLIVPFCTMAGSAPGQSVPPPVGQISADCRSSVYATDQLVCADATLHALDAELRGLWTSAALASQGVGPDYRVQSDWFSATKPVRLCGRSSTLRADRLQPTHRTIAGNDCKAVTRRCAKGWSIS